MVCPCEVKDSLESIQEKKLVENYLQDKKDFSVKNQTSFQVILLLKHTK